MRSHRGRYFPKLLVGFEVIAQVQPSFGRFEVAFIFRREVHV